MIMHTLVFALAAGSVLVGCEQSASDGRKNTTSGGAATGSSGPANPDRNRPVSADTGATARPTASPDTRPDPTKAADNTAQNKPDRDMGRTTTPEDQSNSGSDVELTAAIRRAVMDDAQLSTTAKNCKIIADKSGTVTLRGVVKSQAEKDSIESYARQAANVTWIDNQLEVKAPD